MCSVLLVTLKLFSHDDKLDPSQAGLELDTREGLMIAWPETTLQLSEAFSQTKRPAGPA